MENGTYEDWRRRAGRWWWSFVITGLIGGLASAHLAGWFRLGFEHMDQAMSHRMGQFFGNAALNPVLWISLFSCIMHFRAASERDAAAVREGKEIAPPT